ncbi:zinc ribbon domain-containing protein [Cognatishimia sp. D5M38]|uniref:Zinc ribbon domain-containing protein n=1 Tax=Cognatishimia coralii TaxID=3083254 RepID=A0ABU8QCG8_9RHOB
MPNLSPGTIVAETKCGDCGKPVKVKLNKNGNAYYNCPHVDENLERCNHSQRWGKASSQKMQRNFIASRKSQENIDEVKSHEPADAAEPIGTDTGVSKHPDRDDPFSAFA